LAFNGTKVVPIFIKIGQLVQKLRGGKHSMS